MNDGSALVAYHLAVVVVVSGAFSVAQAGLDFLLIGGGGLLLGLVLARLVLPLWARIGEPAIMTTV